MKKDNIKDYATEAFRYYAACGRKTSEELRQEVKAHIYAQSNKEGVRGSSMPTDATALAAMKAEETVMDMQAEFMDIIAVEKTLRQLTKYQRQAVEIVYFAEAKKELARGDISKRVHMAEMKIPAGEKTIYTWLRRARIIFAKERGLRTK